MALETKDIRNLALVGHTGAGKTMLAEAMLLASGVLNEMGSIEKGTTVSDYGPEEKEAQRSISNRIVDAVARLHADRTLAARLGEAARAKVGALYDRRMAKQRLAAIYATCA